MSEPGRNAEIILVSKSGSLLLQHRDNKPNITNPDHITSFGGHVEPGETPLQAAQRELSEETNLDLPLNRFTHYGTYQKTEEVHGEDWTVDYFVVTDVDPSTLEVYEGQGFVEVKNAKELEKHKTSILFSQVAKDWFSQS